MYTANRIIHNEKSRKLETVNCYRYVEISDEANSSLKCVLTDKYFNEYLQPIKNFKVYEDDVWIVTFPKCGTTWAQEMIWLIDNNLDFETAKKTRLSSRFPYFEFGGISNEINFSTLEICENLQRPRHIKSHLPLFLLPDHLWTVKPKIFYVARNPKDAAVSYYHHYRNIVGFLGSKDEFFDLFLEDKLIYSPYSSHVKEFWLRSKEFSNVMFLFYENMKKDLQTEVRKTMNFLGKNYEQQDIDALCQHLSFDSMKNNSAINWVPNVLPPEIKNESESKFEFVRQGKTGSYLQEMSDDHIRKFDEYSNRFSDIEELTAVFNA